MNLIVAADAAWGIGKDGEQMVYIAPDLKRFRRLTSGHPVLVGRKTLATFPGGRPLKTGGTSSSPATLPLPWRGERCSAV